MPRQNLLFDPAKAIVERKGYPRHRQNFRRGICAVTGRVFCYQATENIHQTKDGSSYFPLACRTTKKPVILRDIDVAKFIVCEDMGGIRNLDRIQTSGVFKRLSEQERTMVLAVYDALYYSNDTRYKTWHRRPGLAASNQDMRLMGWRLCRYTAPIIHF